MLLAFILGQLVHAGAPVVAMPRLSGSQESKSSGLHNSALADEDNYNRNLAPVSNTIEPKYVGTEADRRDMHGMGRAQELRVWKPSPS